MNFFGNEGSEKKEEIWIEKYRPKDLSTYIGNEHIKEKFSGYIESNDPPHILLYGRPGTGKTTLAKILANNIECDSMYINASDYTGIENVREKIRPYAASVGRYGLKLIILDEFDFMSPGAQASLRNIMETYIESTRFILTCNYIERISEPIISRTKTGIFEVVPPSRKEVAVHASTILEAEGIKFKLEDVALIVNANYPDIRGVVGSLQLNISNKELKVNKKALIDSDFKLKYISILKAKNSKRNCYQEIRQLFADHHVTDFSNLFRLLYDSINEIAPGNTAEAILEIADAQRHDAVVVDKEINAMAMTIKLINILKGD